MKCKVVDLHLDILEFILPIVPLLVLCEVNFFIQCTIRLTSNPNLKLQLDLDCNKVKP